MCNFSVFGKQKNTAVSSIRHNGGKNKLTSNPLGSFKRSSYRFGSERDKPYSENDG